MSLWWLSFCDAKRPKGSQFLGACLTPGETMIDAVKSAHALACNPGGEVIGQKVPHELEPHVGMKWRGRVLTRQECAQLAIELAPFAPS